jgi:hypothetical protein
MFRAFAPYIARLAINLLSTTMKRRNLLFSAASAPAASAIGTADFAT